MQHKIEAKIKKVSCYVSLLQEYKVDCKERFVKDPMFEGALLRYLYLASDGCIAIAEMILKHKNLGTSQSYYEAMIHLENKTYFPESSPIALPR